MKKKVNINDIDFKLYLENALKSYGYLFPETDEQMAIYEQNAEDDQLPEKFESPEFIFESELKIYVQIDTSIDNSEGDRNWSLAAREGKEITDEVFDKMKRDKKEAKKKQNGNK